MRKVWEELTIPTFAKQTRYGAKAGQFKPPFLDAALFNEMVLNPYRDAKFEAHTGPFLFEFQRHGPPAQEFLSRLTSFWGNYPKIFGTPWRLRMPDFLPLIITGP
jgi:hypothetical protein